MEHVHDHTLWEMVAETLTAEELRPLLALWLGVLGSVMGSFLDCIASRHGSGESFLKGRSHCDSCGHTLAAWEMIPIVSWPLFRGKCRHCGAHIPVICWLAEVAGAAGFAALAYVIGGSLELVMWLIFAALLLEISLIDARELIIPDGLLIAAALVRLVFWAIGGFDWAALGQMAIGALSVSVPLLLVALLMDKVLKRESMGGGDIKLMAVLGLYFPWQQMIFLVLAACVLGLFGGLVSKKRGKPFPFGPYIALAALVTRLAGGPAVAWYLGLF